MPVLNEVDLTKPEAVDTVKKALHGIIKNYGIKTLDNTLEEDDTSIYSFISREMPLICDERIPPRIVYMMSKVGTCSCTNGRNVFFSSELFVKMMEEMADHLSKRYATTGIGRAYDKTSYPYLDLYQDIQNILFHEYTHILCRHSNRLERFVNSSKNDKHIETYRMAQEIEANRGHCICKGNLSYDIAVTEDAFPETKGVVGLNNIYEVLLRTYGNGIESVASGKSSSKGSSGKKLSEEQKEAIRRTVSGNDGKENNQQSGSTGTKNGDGEGEKAASGSPENKYEEPKNHDGEDGEESEGKSASYGGLGTTVNLPPIHDIDELSVSDIISRERQRVMKKFFDGQKLKLKGMLSGADIAVGREQTYSRPSRKDYSGNGNLMLKGSKRGKVKSPKVLIAMDSSGSMDGTTSAEVLNSIDALLKVIGKSSKGSWVCMHDNRVSEPLPLHRYKEVVSKFAAEGGNNFNEVLKVANKLGVDLVLNVGDGYDIITDWEEINKANKRGLRWVDVIIVEECKTSVSENMMQHERRSYINDYDIKDEKEADSHIIKREVVKLR